MAKWPPLVAVGGAGLCALLVTILTVATPASVEAAGTCDTSSAALDGAELEMIRLHNEMRAQHGLSALTASSGLSRTAAWKSGDASASGPTFSHTDSLGRGPSERAQDCGFPAEAAENIAFGYDTAAEAFDAWMASTGHRNNILMSYYTTIGVGFVGDRWTANYGISGDAAAPVPAPTQAPPPPPPSAATVSPVAVTRPALQPPLPTATVVIPTATPVPPTPTPEPPPPLPEMTHGGPTNAVTAAFVTLDNAVRFVHTHTPGSPGVADSQWRW